MCMTNSHLGSPATATPTDFILVSSLKNTGDGTAWNRFYKRYVPLLTGLALRSGLNEHEAEEAVSRTLISFLKNLPGFQASSNYGSFRSWLLQNAAWRIHDVRKERLPVPHGADGQMQDTTGVAPYERLTDPKVVDLSDVCDAKFHSWVLQEVLTQLRTSVKADHYQIFHLIELEGKSIQEVASLVGRNRPQVYVIKCRVSRTLRKIGLRFLRDYALAHPVIS